MSLCALLRRGGDNRQCAAAHPCAVVACQRIRRQWIRSSKHLNGTAWAISNGSYQLFHLTLRQQKLLLSDDRNSCDNLCPCPPPALQTQTPHRLRSRDTTAYGSGGRPAPAGRLSTTSSVESQLIIGLPCSITCPRMVARSQSRRLIDRRRASSICRKCLPCARC